MKSAIKEAKRILAIKGYQAEEQELKRAYWRIVKEKHTCNGDAIASSLENLKLVTPLQHPVKIEIDNKRTFALCAKTPNPPFIICGPVPANGK